MKQQTTNSAQQEVKKPKRNNSRKKHTPLEADQDIRTLHFMREMLM